MSPTTAFRSLSIAPPSPPIHHHNSNYHGNSVLDDDDIFGEAAPRQPPTTASHLDDVFGCSPPSAAALSSSSSPNSTINHHRRLGDEVSDIPRLRSVHVTAGYRDGIAVSKAAHVQEGFDEGFPLGAVMGLRAGRVVGVLEGVVGALRCAFDLDLDQEKEKNKEKEFAATKHLLRLAREELDVGALFGPQYFDEEGIWRFGVDGNEDDITFEVVAARHPVLAKWEKTVEQLARDLDLDLWRLDRRAREDQSDVEHGAPLLR
ncbi:hypothetical protein IWZ03DRAFT_313553 [Phyllosticta citriasiana]|uniref:Protein YAE1 n=1 Tax=Phyllosticta citriasiana TaxID=595635 RepID=A0ABR1KNP9_9PEZI